MIDLNTIKDADLQNKIDNLKAERERTAETLAKYEKEMEARKTRLPLGVPLTKTACENDGVYYVVSWGAVDSAFAFGASRLLAANNAFSSQESAERHAEMLLTWRKALVANAKSEPIDIEVLRPLLPKGWVAMNRNGTWWWYEDKPEFGNYSGWIPKGPNDFYRLAAFKIKPAEDWKNSLRECGL